MSVNTTPMTRSDIGAYRCAFDAPCCLMTPVSATYGGKLGNAATHHRQVTPSSRAIWQRGLPNIFGGDEPQDLAPSQYYFNSLTLKKFFKKVLSATLILWKITWK